MVKSADHRSSEAMEPLVPYSFQLRQALLNITQHLPRLIRTAVIYHNDFMGHVIEAQFQVKVLNRRANAHLFILRGNDDRKKLQRTFTLSSPSHNAAETRNQSGCSSACNAISSRIVSREVLGSHPHTRLAIELSRTIHGTS